MITPYFAMLRQLAWECLGGSGAGGMLLGMWFAWQKQWHRSDVEERLKGRKITETMALRQIRFIEIRVALLICGGFAMVIVAVYNVA